MKWLKWALIAIVLALAAVGAVGTWRWVGARIHPPPAKPPELGRRAVEAPLVDAVVPTKREDLTREQVLERAKAFGLTLQKPSSKPANAPGTPPSRKSDTALGLAAVYPVSLAIVDFGPGRKGDTGQAWCYVPAEGAAAEIRIRWTSPAPTLAEAAGCAAAQGAQKVEDAAAAVGKALGRDVRLALRGGLGYGSGGPGVLALASLQGRTKRGHAYAVDGAAWLSQRPSYFVGLTRGFDVPIFGGKN